MLAHFRYRFALLICTLVMVLIGLPYATPPAVAATDIIVNEPTDVVNDSDGRCTLREALLATNTTSASGTRVGECAAGGGDTVIRFTFAGTIELSSSLPPIERSVTLLGGADTAPGAEPLITLDGTGAHRILVIRAGTVRIQRLHFTRGKAQGGSGGIGRGGAGGGGGGAGMGGAIFIAGGSVTIENSRFTFNEARGGRGGDSLATGPTAGYGGGGGGGMGVRGSDGVLNTGGCGAPSKLGSPVC